MVLLAFVCFDERCPHRVYIENGTNNVTETDLADSNSGSNYPVAAVAILLWTGTLQLFTMSRPLSALIFTVGTMVSEVSKVLMVLVIILLAFSTALACVGTDQAVFADFGAALKSLSQLMLNLDPPVFDLSSQAAAIFLVAFVLVSVIGVLNILIAQVPGCHLLLPVVAHAIFKYAVLFKL